MISSIKRTFGCMIAVSLGAVSAQAALINVSNPYNVLATSDTVTASDAGVVGGGTGSPFNVTSVVVDGTAPDATQDAAFIFLNTGTDSLSITGFNAVSGFKDIRIFNAPGDPNRDATSVTAYYSTSSTSSLLPGSYASLGTFTPLPLVETSYYGVDPTSVTTGRGYYDLAVAAPAGTQSLLLQFSGEVSGTRVYEVQALVPEPASLGLLAVGTLSFLARRRRV